MSKTDILLQCSGCGEHVWLSPNNFDPDRDPWCDDCLDCDEELEICPCEEDPCSGFLNINPNCPTHGINKGNDEQPK